MRVLVVDDDDALLANIRTWLTGSGFAVDVSSGAHAAMGSLAAGVHDVVVLDVMLGEPVDGVEVCSLLRRSGIATPILLLTARDAVADRVRGLRAGADDYLVKPFALEELEARIHALLRRHLADRSSVLRIGDLELDTAGRRARAAGTEVPLTDKEALMLEFLLLHRGRPQPQEAIYASVWGHSDAPVHNLVDAYAGRLRHKLAAVGAQVTLVARKRQGYVLEQRRPAGADTVPA